VFFIGQTWAFLKARLINPVSIFVPLVCTTTVVKVGDVLKNISDIILYGIQVLLKRSINRNSLPAINITKKFIRLLIPHTLSINKSGGHRVFYQRLLAANINKIYLNLQDCFSAKIVICTHRHGTSRPI